MPFKKAVFLLTVTRSAALRGAGLLLLAMLAMPTMAGAETFLAPGGLDGAPDISTIGNGDSGGASLPSGTTTNTAPSTTSGGATGTSTGTGSSVININGQNLLCNQQFADAFDKARAKALTVSLSRDNQYFQYQVAGAFAANCVGKLVGYAQNLADAVASVQTAATAGNLVQGIVAVLAHRILHAILQQIINNLENQICSITNQLTSAINSVVQNAICIPSGDLNLGGIGNFNLNLNLPNLQCDGIAINPLTIAQIDPNTGKPYSQGEAGYAAGALSVYGSGGGTMDAAYGGPPMRDNYQLGTGADLSGEPDVLDYPDSGEVVQSDTSAPAAGNYCFDLNKAIANREANADPTYIKGKDGHCGVGVRTGLCQGGLTYWCTGHGDAYQMGSGLIASGAYYKYADNIPQASYVPQAGDIIVIQPYGKHTVGHIQMFLGDTWASDFKTPNMFGVQPRPPPNYTIYRLKPNTTANGNGTCS